MRVVPFAFLETFKSRLSRQIVLWVFISILVVEGIILVPAARNEHREKQQQIERKATVSIKTLAQLRGRSDNAAQLLNDIRLSQTALSVPLLGASIYNSQGQRLDGFGKVAIDADTTINGDRRGNKRNLQKQRYEILLSAQQLGWPYTVALSYDATKINHSLYAFIGRIVGLVLIISAFVTASTFWVLQRLIISPLQQIRRQLLIAMSAQSRSDLYLPERPLKRGDRNEIDKVIEAFNQRTAQLEAQIEKTRQALADVQTAQAQLIQSEKMSSLGQLVAGIAHEINNPASFVAGNLYHLQTYFEELVTFVQKHQAQMAKEMDEADLDLDFIAADWEKVVRSMESGAQRIQSIVLSLRSFSRLDESAFKTVDIHAGIDSALLLLNSRLAGSTSRMQSISVVKDYGDLPAIACFPAALNQVFLQILSNAIDALIQKQEERDRKERNQEEADYPPTITIQTRFLSEKNKVTISITDNGAGMSVETKERMFDPFFTTKPVGQGTGMGLAVSYQTIVGRHKGALTCRATPQSGITQSGTTFTIELPAELSPGIPTERSTESSAKLLVE